VILAIAGLLLYVPAIGRYGWKLEVLLVLSLLLGSATEAIAARLGGRPPRLAGYPAWILLPLVMPPALPLWMSALSVVFAAVMVVAFFGGYGRHPMAPVAVGWAFARLSFATTFGFSWSYPFPHPGAGYGIWNARLPTVDHPLSVIADRVSIPLLQTLTGGLPSSPAMALPILVLVAGLVLLLLRVTSARTCAGFLGAHVVLLLVLPSASTMSLAPSLLTGDLLFAAFFVLADQRTCARTLEGRWLTGVLAGGAAFLIRHYAAYADGVFFAVLLANVFAPILDEAILVLERRKETAS